jgi:hypothetical protein
MRPEELILPRGLADVDRYDADGARTPDARKITAKLAKLRLVFIQLRIRNDFELGLLCNFFSHGISPWFRLCLSLMPLRSRSSCAVIMRALPSCTLVEGREPRDLTLGRLAVPLRHRADEREFLRRQQIGALATALDHLARVVIINGRRCDLRRFTTREAAMAAFR